jgi:sucrose-phosphate synthase
MSNRRLQAVHAGRTGSEKDARLEFLAWRIWHMKRKHARVIHHRKCSATEDTFDFVTAAAEPASHGYTSDEDGGEGARSRISPSAAAAEAHADRSLPDFSELTEMPSLRRLSVKLPDLTAPAKPATNAVAIDSLLEEYMMSPKELGLTPMATPQPQRLGRLYVVMISLHGLVRGDRMELGRDSDTGGQVKYVVELARAMALHPAVHRVDLLTRLIRDPRVDPEYGVEEECISREGREKDLGGAYIVRLPCGPVHKYVHKEALWPHVREFADRGIAHVSRTLNAMADVGKRCELYCVHGHYADAGEAAVLMCATLDSPLVVTGHSLGRNKLEHLLSSGTMTRAEIEATYAISRRIEAEERCLDVAAMVFTSTQQEVDEQWGLYDGYQPNLARVLRFRRSYGRHMPLMKVSPPGLDFSNLKVTMPEDPVLKEFEAQRAVMTGFEFTSQSALASPTVGARIPAAGASSFSDVSSPVTLSSSKVTSPAAAVAASVPDAFQVDPTGINGPPIWQDIARYLRNPLKPAILAMSRPDAKKNLTTLVKAFGEHAMLRELANLVLIMVCIRF